jgi:L-fuconolactonase
MLNGVPPHEPILEPDLPIIDPHHHLWDWPESVFSNQAQPEHGFTTVIRRCMRYLLPELLADLESGHNICATVFMECGAMYKADGLETFRCVGETEFANGVAAMSASGRYGKARICAGIVGHADLTQGASVRDVLEAHQRAGGGRLRGVRHAAPFDADPQVLGRPSYAASGLYHSPQFRQGFAQLANCGLSFDAWLFEPQLPDVIDLARSFPDVPLILDHLGTPLGNAAYQGEREARFAIWHDNIRKLAALPNVSMKVGGLGMVFCNFPSFLQEPAAPASQLASEWKPYVETAIEAFGTARCMFESNFPVDLGACNYKVLWNAFKILAKDCSADEKADLFYGTANRVYKLDL